MINDDLLPIECLDLSVRTLNALKNNGVCFLGELRSYNNENLMELSGLGKTSAEEVQKTVQRWSALPKEEQGRIKVAYELNVASVNRNIENLLRLFDESKIAADAFPVDNIGLSVRTVNALKNNNVYTLVELLRHKGEFIWMSGLGKKGVKEIENVLKQWASASDERIRTVISTYNETGIMGGLEEQSKMEIGEYLQSLSNKKKTLAILVDYYSVSPRMTLKAVGEKYGVTNERIRQIVLRGLDSIRDGIIRGKIDSSFINAIKEAADKKTEISMIGVSDSVFGKKGLVRLAAALYDDIMVLDIKKLHGEWIVRKKDNVGRIIDELSKMLQNRDMPVKLNDLQTIFSIPEEMLFSIENIEFKDGYVTLSTNKVATGKGRYEIISNYILRVGRPASIEEISKNTGLSLNQVRGGVSCTDRFMNVGKTVYDLVENDYSDLSISELARNILVAENRALKILKIIEYVLRYRDGVEDYDVVRELFNDAHPIVYRKGEYVLLNEWGVDMIELPKKRHYNMLLEDAIMDIVPEIEGIFTAGSIAVALRNKFGGAVSTNLNSIKQKLSMLAYQEKIVSVGDRTGCYVKANKK